jgi:hypothetical protein
VIGRENRRRFGTGHFDASIAGESRLSAHELDAGTLESTLATLPKARHDLLFAFADAREIYADGATVDAIVSGSPSQMRDPRTRNHGLGRAAPFIDARAANVDALDEGSTLSGARKRTGQGTATLTGTDDRELVMSGLHRWLKTRAR